jgi:hypothetical protein
VENDFKSVCEKWRDEKRVGNMTVCRSRATLLKQVLNAVGILVSGLEAGLDMSAHSRSSRTSRAARKKSAPGLGKRALRLADVRRLARINPDPLAGDLLRWRKRLKSSQQRRELWHLLQNLGGTAVVKRAVQTIDRTRCHEELEAVLRAATSDVWTEVVPALQRRFTREVRNLKRRAAGVQLWNVFHAMAQAAGRLHVKFPACDIRVLLRHPSSRIRAAGAEIAALQLRSDLVADCLPLCWDRGEASVFAGELIGRLGTVEQASVLWSRTLNARKGQRENTVRRLVHILSLMGAFDIQLALKLWIEEDFAEAGACAWHYAPVWARLTAAKMAAGVCTRDEALDDLHWFVRIAGSDPNRGFGGYGAENGPFHIARHLVQLGDAKGARELLETFAERGLPPPQHFPELLFPELERFIHSDKRHENTAWLAALGSIEAQNTLLESWHAAFHEARWPEHWEARSFLDSETVLALLRRSLRTRAPGVLRQILGLLGGDPSLQHLKPELQQIASKHASSVVRWKARRVLRALKNGEPSGAHPARHWRETFPLPDHGPQRFLRLDAAVLSGALRPSKRQRKPVAAKPREKTGLLPPAHPGGGWTLQTDKLTAAERRATLKELCGMPLSHALIRPVPFGPSLEERPDLRATRELAPPGNEIDERMIEMAQAVMGFWNEGDETLGLDEEGIALIASGLCNDVRMLEEDDVLACGAFIGEVLRKQLGGNWTGYDDHYMLEVASGAGVLDPVNWAREVSSKKDPVEGTKLLLGLFQDAIQRFRSPKRHHFHRDPSVPFSEAVQRLCGLPPRAPMTDLLAESRVLSYRLEAGEWPSVFDALEPLLSEPGAPVRAVAAISIYAPTEALAQAWVKWGAKLRGKSGLLPALAEAMQAAEKRDDLEAMPNWTLQPQESRHGFLTPLRKQMPVSAWKKILLLLLRQRAVAGDCGGVAWCLYSYKYEFADCLALVKLFCEMSVSARQTVLQATFHATRDERGMFRPLWAEGLRDPAAPVALAALDASSAQHARSLRPLVLALCKDAREPVSAAASELAKIWEG